MIEELKANEIYNHIFYQLVFVIIREIVLYAIENISFFHSEEKMSEIDQLKCQIEQLKNEAESYNNPGQFSTFAKIKRQITKLEQDLEQKISQENLRNSNKKNSIQENIFIKFFLSMNSKVRVQFLFWIFSLIRFILMRNQYLILNNENIENNIVSLLYFNKEMDRIQIPMNRILLIETLFISNIKKLLKQGINEYIKKEH
ncbi:MAG: hypothetical protein MJ252_12210, partial [archaeon]|nr:hypothetical protein [archaeon]